MATISSKSDLRHACRTWAGSEEAFRQIVIAYLAQSGAYEWELARELGMAESTIARWVSGISRPHPAFQAAVVARIGKKVDASAKASHKFKVSPAAIERRNKGYKLKKLLKSPSHPRTLLRLDGIAPFALKKLLKSPSHPRGRSKAGWSGRSGPGW